MLGIFRLAEKLLPSQEELCLMILVSAYAQFVRAENFMVGIKRAR
jgi:hypothetical protein